MSLFKKRRIFMDYAGGEHNPSGIHKEGVEARRALEDARLKIARILGAQQRDIIFTSGGTESDNLAVLGVFEKAKEEITKPHIVISDNEHPAVLESAKEAERRGAELSVVPVEKIVSNIKENTVLVSITCANNQTGAINPVAKIARLVRELRKKNNSKYPLIHTDATAVYEYLDVSVEKLQADLISIDKVLVVRPTATIRPLVLGGGQERGLRSGTQNVASLLKFAQEFEETVANRDVESKRLEKIKKVFVGEIEKCLSEAVINTPEQSLPNIVNLSFPGKLHEFLAIKLDEAGVAVSTGSSCDSSKSEDDKEALRFSFGQKTSESEAKETIRILKSVLI